MLNMISASTLRASQSTYSDPRALSARSSAAVFPSLTGREREVLEMVARGKGNATIAHELMISLKTVRNHVSNIFVKLQVPDRAAAIVKAREEGLGGG